MERNVSEELWRRDKGEAKDSWVGVRSGVGEWVKMQNQGGLWRLQCGQERPGLKLCPQHLVGVGTSETGLQSKRVL